jgi:hypothetical protein
MAGAMSRARDLGRLTFYVVFRTVGTVFPPSIAYVLMWPYAAIRAIRPAMTERHLPASRLPAPEGERPSFARRWRFQQRIQQRWLPLLWSDRWEAMNWGRRFTAVGADGLDELFKTKPVVMMTLHTGGFIALGGWLGQYGVGIGSVIVDRRVWARTEQARSDPRWADRWGDSAAFLRGDARSMVRYLAPGRCLLLPADHPRGHSVEGEWAGGRLTLSSGGFRIARLAGATVVPAVVMDDGRWRYRVHVGHAVPQELIDAGDEQAAASHVARELMPIAAERPEQAAITLVWATLPAAEAPDPVRR